MWNLPDFWPLLQYVTEQIKHFIDNPYLALGIYVWVQWILNLAPGLKKVGLLISCFMGMVITAILANVINAPLNIWYIIFFWCLLWFVTSKSHDLLKSWNTDKKKVNSNNKENAVGNIPEKDAIYDKPRDEDRRYELVYWEDDTLPNKVLLGNGVPIQSQFISRNPSTDMACGSYGIGHATNVANAIENSQEYILCHMHRWDFVAFYTDIYEERYNMNPLTDWSYLQHQIDFARKKDLIAGYARVRSAAQMRQALSNWHLIYTGTSNIDWWATIDNDNKAVRGRWYWHAFCIDWYDWKRFRCRNSWGPGYMDNGWFWIHEDDIDVLFSKYVIFDKKDQEIVNRFIDTINNRKEKLKNWDKPNDWFDAIILRNMVRKWEI